MFFDQPRRPNYTADERQARAEEITRIIHSPIYTEAVEECEAEAIRQTLMAATPEARERARALVFALHSVGNQLLAMVDDKPLNTDPIDNTPGGH